MIRRYCRCWVVVGLLAIAGCGPEVDPTPPGTPPDVPPPVISPDPIADPPPVDEPPPIVEPAPIDEPPPIGEPDPIDVPPPVDDPPPVDEPPPIDEPDPNDGPIVEPADPAAGGPTADANGDGVVDTADYQVWASHEGTATSAGPAGGDFNGDATVDRLDYAEWSRRRVAKRTWYVATDGSDGNPGSEQAPWLTIRRAASLADAGDRVVIRPGVYTTPANVKHSGTAEAPIAFVAAGPGVILDGSRDNSNEGFSAQEKRHLHLEGLTVRGWFREGIAMYDVDGLVLIDVTVKDCGIRRHKWDHGVSLERCDKFTLYRVTATHNYANGIYVVDSDDGLLRQCTADENDGTDGSDGILIQNARDIRLVACSARATVKTASTWGDSKSTSAATLITSP
ncbi:MAG: right-handed parallel beta-helix repeat-containing protein [Pirellulales bacterium]